MRNDVDLKDHLTTAALQKWNKPLKVRSALYRALFEHLKVTPADDFLVIPSLSSIDEVRHYERMPFANAAQELALLVAVGKGWGPHHDDIEECAKTMTTVFFAYCQAFVVEGFPNPAKAAIESMKELGFKL